MREFNARTPAPAHEAVIDCLHAGIEAVLPGRAVRGLVSLDGGTLTVTDETYNPSAYDRILVVGEDKVGDDVVDALEAVLGNHTGSGIVVTPDPTPSLDGCIKRPPGDHPASSARGVKSTQRLVDLLPDLNDRMFVLAAITGSVSVILPAPAEGISLVELQETTDKLPESGAGIYDLSVVRRHVSTLRSGGLARFATPATVVGLVPPGVVGNNLDVVASGPTTPDGTTHDDALDVPNRFDLDVPKPARTRPAHSSAGGVPEMSKPSDPVFDRMTNHVLANMSITLDAAREVADDRGYEPLILFSHVCDETREAAKTCVVVTEKSLVIGNPITAPAMVLSGGECTITVRGDGDGGPNLKLCLAVAMELPDETILVSIDSDGKDGGTEVAGAVVDASSVTAGDVHAALARNDMLPVLREADALVGFGAVGVDVSDLRVLAIGEGT